MIKNEKQYKITKKKLSEITGKIAGLSGEKNPVPLKDQLILVSLQNMKDEMEADIAVFERLKTSEMDTLHERKVADLPSLITEYKIISGLTQKEFAKKLGLKEQQLQRYEAEDFVSISFKNLLKILDLIGLDVHIKKTRIHPFRKKQTDLSDPDGSMA